MPGEFTKEQLLKMLAQAERMEQQPDVPATTVAPQTTEDRYAPTVWGQNEYDFTTPSGQTCRMRKLPVEELLRAGILDRVTRLPGVAQAQVDIAQGLPPAKPSPEEMPSEEMISNLIDLLDLLLPLAVIQPPVHSIPKPDAEGATPEREVGKIYTDSIELADRIAIMERSIGGLKTLDSFRVGSRPTS